MRSLLPFILKLVDRFGKEITDAWLAEVEEARLSSLERDLDPGIFDQ